MTPSDGLAPLLWQALRQQPWLCLQVLGGIHWQALKLWRRGVRFFRLPLQRPERLGWVAPSARAASLQSTRIPDALPASRPPPRA